MIFMNKNRKLGAIILAAGRGNRMKAKRVNKVTLLLNDKPLVSYAINLLEKMKIHPIFVVVGHAKKSVMNVLRNTKVFFIEQKKRLGTAHAVKKALVDIPADITDIIILYGDDSYTYNQELLHKIINVHFMNDQKLTLLTIKVDNPAGLGRVIRDKTGMVMNIIEEKDASIEQRQIKEINPNCYIFQTEFLKKYLPQVPISPITGEYYLPGLIKLARDFKEEIKVIDAGLLPWKGVNTLEDLAEANSFFNDVKPSI